MVYRTSTDNTVDVCTIDVFDGANDLCMPQDLLDDRRSDAVSEYVSIHHVTLVEEM